MLRLLAPRRALTRTPPLSLLTPVSSLPRPLSSRLTAPLTLRSFPANSRAFSTELDPADKKDYDAYVQMWLTHFEKCDDDFELERGLNQIFAADWVPSYEVIVEALKASRRLDTFSTAVRIIEGLEEKVESKGQYDTYLKELKPMMEELGIPERKELGGYRAVRDPSRYWY